MAEEKQKKKPDDLLKEARDNMNEWYSYYELNNRTAQKFAEFVLEEQWDAEEKYDYDSLFRKPRLTLNKLYSHVTQLVGEQRKNEASIELRAKNIEVPQQEVDVLADLIKDIAYHSRNNIVYDTAFENALIRGYGGIRIYTEYEDSTSFKQVIKLQVVPDPAKMFFDPVALEKCKQDGNYCGIYEPMSRKLFKKLYPNIEDPKTLAFPRQERVDWVKEDEILIADYFVKEWTKARIALLHDGSVMLEKEAKKTRPEDIIQTRETEDYIIRYYKLIEGHILEESVWPSKYFPIIFVDGDSHFLEGREIIKPFVKFARDAQRFYNYVISEQANNLKRSHGSKWLMTPSNLKGLSDSVKNRWLNPEVNAVLVANPDDTTKAMPQLLPPPSASPALTEISQTSDNVIESILGRPAAARGAAGLERTGVALGRSITQANMAAFVYFDNLHKAIEEAGRIILDLIPIIYDTPRSLSLKNNRNEARMVHLNELSPQGFIINNMENAKYMNIEVQAGSSFAIQKAEAIQQLMQFLQTNPQLSTILSDLVAENLDLKNMPQIVQRIKDTILPPSIVAKESGKPPPPPQPSPQMMLEQQQIKVQAQKNQAAMMDAKAKEMEAAYKMAELRHNAFQPDPGVQSTRIRATAEVEKAQTQNQTELLKMLANMEKEELEKENEKLKAIVRNVTGNIG